jgi:non-heme chloroperoxidase
LARKPDCIRALVLAMLIALTGPLTVASPSGTKGAPQSRKAEIPGGFRLQYLEWGTSASPPLVLLAGLGDTAYIFEVLGPLLAPHFHVFAVTRRGYGESSLTREGYAIGERADDLRAFLDALKLDRVYLAGHSVAGDELTAFAAKYGQRLRLKDPAGVARQIQDLARPIEAATQ